MQVHGILIFFCRGISSFIAIVEGYAITLSEKHVDDVFSPSSALIR